MKTRHLVLVTLVSIVSAAQVFAQAGPTPPNATGYGIHFVLKSDKETVSVHLGPAWFLAGSATGPRRTSTLAAVGAGCDRQVAALDLRDMPTKRPMSRQRSRSSVMQRGEFSVPIRRVLIAATEV